MVSDFSLEHFKVLEPNVHLEICNTDGANGMSIWIWVAIAVLAETLARFTKCLARLHNIHVRHPDISRARFHFLNNNVRISIKEMRIKT